MNLRSLLGGMACDAILALSGPALAAPACGGDAPALSGAPGLARMAASVAAGEPVRILAIGSSSTEGIGASSPAMAYPRQLAEELEEAWPTVPVEVVNAGVGGETADQTLARLERALGEGPRPDLVLWQVGTNDAVRGGDEAAFRALVARGVGLARAAGVDLVLLDQQFYPATPDRARYERYVGHVADVAAQARVGLFSRYALMKTWGAQGRDVLAGMLAADGFHMSDQGYDCLADALGRAITGAVARNPAMTTARGRGTVPPELRTTRRG